MKTVSCEDMIDIESNSLEDISLSRGTSKSSSSELNTPINPVHTTKVPIMTNTLYILYYIVVAFVLIVFITLIIYLVNNKTI